MSFFGGMLVVRRMTGGAVGAGGVWVEGVETKINIKASVQPATPKELLALEENRRNRQTFILYTKTKLDTVEAQNPYRIRLFKSTDDYEVVGVEPWQNGILPHFRITVQKIEPTAEMA